MNYLEKIKTYLINQKEVNENEISRIIWKTIVEYFENDMEKVYDFYKYDYGISVMQILRKYINDKYFISTLNYDEELIEEIFGSKTIIEIIDNNVYKEPIKKLTK